MAHECPECGQWCHCGGDIDDCGHNLPEDQDRCTHCDVFGDREEDDDPEGCCYPDGQCCMPGPHRMSECHTAEMIEEQFAANSHALTEDRSDDSQQRVVGGSVLEVGHV